MRHLFVTDDSLQLEGRRLAVQLQTAAVVRTVFEITAFPEACIRSTREEALELAAACVARTDAGGS